MSKTISFCIERVDNLGQGVSFDAANDKVNLIPKTLPGEEGVAKVTGTKGKKVQFAKVESLSAPSSDRITPECTHFSNCNGCSFLHTSYEKESVLKKDSYSFLFRRYSESKDILYTHAPHRTAYRNRLQLHYNLKSKQIGYMADGKILEVPSCLLPHPTLQSKLKELYNNQDWLKLIDSNQPVNGHIELYLKDLNSSEVSIAINERYAHDGFTQVFQEMNDKIMASLKLFIEKNPLSDQDVVIDLFGGDGNLTRSLNSPTLVVDYYTEPKIQREHQNFLSLNLYKSFAPKKVLEELKKKFEASAQVSWLILDPPRSGLKNLNEYVELIRPKRISYLSCNPNTQVRDLGALLENGWVIESIEFLDLFPSTHHLESFVHLKKAQ